MSLAARLSRVLAEVTGFATLADSYHPSSPEPAGTWEARAMQLALDDAGAPPEQVSALIAHATATPKGDAAEIAAINTIYRPRRAPLPVASLTGHLGHTGAASGAMSIMAAAHAMRSGSFPNVPVWGADQTPVVPGSAQAVQPRTYFPPAGGFRFCFFTLGPATAALPADFDAAAAAAQVALDIPGLLDLFEPDNPGMHTSDTVDVDFVLSGEVDVELDDGAEVHLKAGDVLVQNGTRHAWRNKSDQPCVLVVAVTGARRD